MNRYHPFHDRAAAKQWFWYCHLADHLARHPEKIERCKQNLARMRESNPWGKLFHDRWERLLEGPLDALLEAMKDPSSEMCDLRQESPFCGIISQKERLRIFMSFEDEFEAMRKRVLG
ncbi:hypothetical protein MIN45_P0858 [Methylomarinovum tepidoasis]|uniref:Uncharacterized protein n=1 Tax=Methylomarinovum tepidoasis TaxID=2840183 RepID=A0AAU9C5P3_9GAMM|nr:hypothetical protein [Methylomarinovum sp. IN45]BCX88489.1 hypothetical protein MIN45_P0858 [Methylomarinovum sp. IN45]